MTSWHRALLVIALFMITAGLLMVLQFQNYGKLRMIFCDVGQGDGMLFITPSGREIVLDGGPGNKILSCLSTKMPFLDRTIDMVVNTHPQQDHLEGLVDVLNKYQVKMVGTTGVDYSSQLFQTWKSTLSKSGAKIYTPSSGDRLEIDKNVYFDVVWPTRDKVEEWKTTPPADVNDTSVILRLVDGNFCAYFTGDIPKEILDSVVDRKCDLLKVAHHGSKTGTDEQTLAEVEPKIAVIQVGVKNRYGHPNQETLDLLDSHGARILRNDEMGTIELDLGKDGSLRTDATKK